MIAITNIDTDYFELNGKRYAKIYQPLAHGLTAIGIYNAYDTNLQILGTTEYDEIAVDSTFYGSQSLLIAALLPVIWKFDGVGYWGEIGGTISNQTDLQSELDGKLTTDGGKLTYTTAGLRSERPVYTTFNKALTLLHTDLGIGQWSQFSIGKDVSTRNCAEFSYNHQGDGSTENSFHFGLFGVQHFSLFGDGRIEMSADDWYIKGVNAAGNYSFDLNPIDSLKPVNMAISTNGSTLSNPASFGMKDLSAGEMIEWRFGDRWNTITNAHGYGTVLHGYHAIIIDGGHAATTAVDYTSSDYAKNADEALKMYAKADRKVIIKQKNNVGRTVDFLQIQNYAGTSLAGVDKDGIVYGVKMKADYLCTGQITGTANANDFLTFMPDKNSVAVITHTTGSSNYMATNGQVLMVRGDTATKSFALCKGAGNTPDFHVGSWNGSLVDWEWWNLFHDGMVGALTIPDGYIMGKRSSGASDTHIAGFGNSGTSGEFVFGGSTSGSTTALNRYIRIGTDVLKYYNGTSSFDIWHSNNDGVGSGLDADLYQGLDMTASGDRWGVMTSINGSGVMELGKYIDWHLTDGSTGDNDGRITLTAANDWTFSGDISCNALTETSDAAMKRNIKSLAGKQSSIQFKEYQFLDDDRVRYGVLAQDLIDTHPELVAMKEVDGKTQYSVHYTGLLCMKMAEKDEQIASLQARLTNLENRL